MNEPITTNNAARDAGQKTKVYTVTVMRGDGSGNVLMDARGRDGLKALVESEGLIYRGLQGYYAERGTATQIKIEWSTYRAWDGDALFGAHKFQEAQ